MRSSFFRISLAAVFCAFLPSSAIASEIWLAIDQVHTRKFGSEIGQIVVGNPSIADVQVGPDQQILFYGKGLGLTNITFFDPNGEQMENVSVRVQNPSSGFLVIHSGVSQVSYSCAARCQAVGSIGDENGVFSTIQSQVAGKAGSALEAAVAAAAQN